MKTYVSTHFVARIMNKFVLMSFDLSRPNFHHSHGQFYTRDRQTSQLKRTN